MIRVPVLNHYRVVIAGLDRRHAESVALFETALAEGVQLIEHALRRIARHREEAAFFWPDADPRHALRDQRGELPQANSSESAAVAKRGVAAQGGT